MLHLSQGPGRRPGRGGAADARRGPVNPRSQPTKWGDILHLHNNDNVRFASDQLEPFDYVLLHASNDLYLRTGAERYVAGRPRGATAFRRR